MESAVLGGANLLGAFGGRQQPKSENGVADHKQRQGDLADQYSAACGEVIGGDAVGQKDCKDVADHDGAGLA